MVRMNFAPYTLLAWTGNLVGSRVRIYHTLQLCRFVKGGSL